MNWFLSKNKYLIHLLHIYGILFFFLFNAFLYIYFYTYLFLYQKSLGYFVTKVLGICNRLTYVKMQSDVKQKLR